MPNLTKAEAAQLLSVTPQRMSRLLNAGRIVGAHKLGGWQWVIPTPIRLVPAQIRRRKTRWESAGGKLADDSMAVHFTSDTPEWNTPSHVVNMASAVLGVIDLDPCSNSKETPNVPALEHFTAVDDGLHREWNGSVYMNPPYGRGIVEWVQHLVNEFDSGRVSEAIALVPARTDARWFQLFAPHWRCFVKGRLKFGNNISAAPFPSVAVYLGAQPEQFRSVFTHLGAIYGPAS